MEAGKDVQWYLKIPLQPPSLSDDSWRFSMDIGKISLAAIMNPIIDNEVVMK